MNHTENSVGIGVLDALLIAFIILKVIGVIKWSWWLVLLPLWIEIILVIIFIIVIIISIIVKNIR